MNLEDLDFEDVRDLMNEEVEFDIDRNKLYMSKRLISGFESNYTALLQDAIVDGDTNSFAQCILNENCLKSREHGRKVPWNAHITLAEGEFNRFYARALCRKAIADGYELEICRVKEVSRARPGSEELSGQTVDPNKLLADLRENIGIETALKIPGGPNSGLSVRIMK